MKVTRPIYLQDNDNAKPLTEKQVVRAVEPLKTKKIPLKASELITILQKKITEVGDLEITVSTREGASYSLYSENDVNVVPWTAKDGTVLKTIEIGYD